MHPKYPERQAVIKEIFHAAEEVLHHLGPGLLESVYEYCLCRELELRGHTVVKEKVIEINYKGATLKQVLRADLIVDDCVVVELKSIEGSIRTEFRMQLLSYLKLLDMPLGLIVNFGATETVRYRRVILAGADS